MWFCFVCVGIVVTVRLGGWFNGRGGRPEALRRSFNDLPAPLVGGIIIVAVVVALAFLWWLNDQIWSHSPFSTSTTSTEQTFTLPSQPDITPFLIVLGIVIVAGAGFIAYLLLKDRF